MNMTVLFLNLEFLTCFLESARRFSSFFPFLFVFSWRRSVSASSSVKFSRHWFTVETETRAQYGVLQEPMILLNPNADWNGLPESSRSFQCLKQMTAAACFGASSRAIDQELSSKKSEQEEPSSSRIDVDWCQVTKWRGRGGGSQTFLLFHMRGRTRNRSTPAMQLGKRFIDQSVRRSLCSRCNNLRRRNRNREGLRSTHSFNFPFSVRWYGLWYGTAA